MKCTKSETKITAANREKAHRAEEHDALIFCLSGARYRIPRSDMQRSKAQCFKLVFIQAVYPLYVQSLEI